MVLPCVTGKVPEALRGVLFRNGPGQMEVFGEPYTHPFDGDGMVTRFGFEGGRVTYRNRFVRTAAYCEEQLAGRMLYRSFGTNRPGGLLRNLFDTRFKNAANTSVLLQNDRLYALWEGGLPHALDPETLETLGEDDFAGALRDPNSRVAPVLPFSAHPKRPGGGAHVYNFGVQGALKPALQRYRLNGDGALEPRIPFSLGGVSFMHDFVVTETKAVFFDVPARFRMLKALSGWASPVESLAFKPDARARVLCFDRDSDAPPIEFTGPEGFVFHFVNAFDDPLASRSAPRVIVDAIKLNRFPRGTLNVRDPDAILNFPYPASALVRFTLDLTPGGEIRPAIERVLHDAPAELPTVAASRCGLPHRVAWAIAGLPRWPLPILPMLRRYDLGNAAEQQATTTGETLPNMHTVDRNFAPDIPSEAIFVPRTARAPDRTASSYSPDALDDSSSDGWLLTVVYRADKGRSDLCILDARTLEDVAVLALPHHIPPSFHGLWDDHRKNA